MSNNIVLASDVKSLIDSWIEAERNGVKFPVPFEIAWRMAEYSNKANAKKCGLRALKKGIQFSSESMKTPGGGRSSELINLSIDGFKHFCLMADTEVGEATRQYFIDTEKKWRLVQQIAPQVAEDVEVLHLKIELGKVETQKALAETQKALAEKALIDTRDAIVNLQPQAIADRVMGITTIEKPVVQTKVVDESGFILNAGDTVSKTELAYRYGFVGKTGKPDTKRVTELINEAIASRAIPNPWKDVRVVASSGFDSNLVDTLDRFYDTSPLDRQRWLGE